MLLETRTFRILFFKKYEYRLRFLQVIEDDLGDCFGHGVDVVFSFKRDLKAKPQSHNETRISILCQEYTNSH